MGLDMYAYKTKIASEDFINRNLDELEDMELFFRWRKHPNLHYWMQELWEEYGGEVFDLSDFNANDTVELDLDDLRRLERTIENDDLPFAEGFFWGESYDPDDPEFNAERKAKDLEFIQQARELIKQGYYIFYSSWW